MEDKNSRDVSRQNLNSKLVYTVLVKSFQKEAIPGSWMDQLGRRVVMSGVWEICELRVKGRYTSLGWGLFAQLE